MRKTRQKLAPLKSLEGKFATSLFMLQNSLCLNSTSSHHLLKVLFNKRNSHQCELALLREEIRSQNMLVGAHNSHNYPSLI